MDACDKEDTAFDREAYERMIQKKDEQHRKRYAHSYRQMAEINQRRYEERMRNNIAPPSPDEEGRR